MRNHPDPASDCLAVPFTQASLTFSSPMLVLRLLVCRKYHYLNRAWKNIVVLLYGKTSRCFINVGTTSIDYDLVLDYYAS